MPTQLQLRRGTTTEHSTFSGAVGEVTVDTTKDTLVVHDGATNGGFPLAKEAGATFGNTNVTGDFSFADNAKAIFGAGSDLEISHDGTENVIDSNSGTLVLRSAGSGTIELRDQGSQVLAQFNDNSDVKLYHNNNEKLATTATGVDVTGGLNTTGNVGIGSSSPEALLHVEGASTGQMMFRTSGSSVNKWLIGKNSSADFSIGDDGNEWLYVQRDSGLVGIGTSSPAYKLSVEGSGTGLSINSTNDEVKKIALANSGSITGYIGSSSSSPIRFLDGSASERMRIASNGNVGIGTSNPVRQLMVQSAVNSTGYTEMLRLEGQTLSNGWERGIGFFGNDGGLEVSRISSYLTGSERHLRFTSAGTLGMTIRETGSVGIGTSSPTSGRILDADGQVRFQSSGTGRYFDFVNDSAASYLDVSHSLNIRTNNASSLTTAMTLDSSGKVGIGTSSPAYKLSILENANNFLQFSQAGDSVVGSLIGRSSSKNLRIQQSENAPIEFWTNNTEAMRIHSAGGLSIGTSNAYSSAFISIQPDDTNRIINTRSYDATSQYHLLFQNNSGNSVGNIFVSTTSTAFNTSSDYRLKTAVTYDWDATSRLKQLKPARFKWIADGDDAVFVDGFLAHECEAVPESITGTKDGMMDEEYQVSAATGDIYTPASEATYDDDGVELTAATDEVIHSTDVEQPEELAEGQQWRETTAAVMGTRSVPDYQGIDQSKLVPLLVKTIQELEARITALEAN